MKTQNSINVLLIVGLTISILVAARSKSPEEQVLPVVRTQQFEVVDKNGKIRASIKVEDDGSTVFRLMDEEQTIRVKLAGSKDGSGVVLLNDETNPGVHMLSKRDRTSIVITDHTGKKKELVP